MTITIPTTGAKNKRIKISVLAIAIFLLKEIVFELIEYGIFNS